MYKTVFGVPNMVDQGRLFYKTLVNARELAWLLGYKTFFILKSAEHEIYPAHKC